MGLLLLAWFAYEAVQYSYATAPKQLRDRIEHQPWRGTYPRGNSLWARLNRPLGWREED
jgi:hypothetical protein